MREPAAVSPPPEERTPAPTLRDATPADLDTVVALERRCYTGTEVYPDAEYRHLLARGPCVNLLLEAAGGDVVAFAGAYTVPGLVTGHVYTVNVDPRHRRQGYATRLLTALEERLLGRGCRASVLEVRVDNVAAITLYERLGYERSLRLEGYYPGPGERDAWQYVKEL